MNCGCSRSYEAVTLNSGEHSSKPLTFEIRLCETHPRRAFAFQNLVMNLTLKYGKIFEIDFDTYQYSFDYVIDENCGFSMTAKELGLKPIEPFKSALNKQDKIMFKDVYRAIMSELHPTAKRVIAKAISDYRRRSP